MNNSVLSWLRKLAADRDVSRSGGRLFQVTGSEKAKLRGSPFDHFVTFTAHQWLNYKKWGKTLPSHSLPFPFLLLYPPLSPSVPCREALPENHLGVLGALRASRWGPFLAANAFWSILSLKSPGSNIFGYLSQLEMVHFTNALRKKQLCGRVSGRKRFPRAGFLRPG